MGTRIQVVVEGKGTVTLESDIDFDEPDIKGLYRDMMRRTSALSGAPIRPFGFAGGANIWTERERSEEDSNL